MASLLELQEDQAHKVKCAEDVWKAAQAAGRAQMTPDEDKTANAFMAQADDIGKTIDQLQAAEQTAARIQSSLHAMAQPIPGMCQTTALATSADNTTGTPTQPLLRDIPHNPLDPMAFAAAVPRVLPARRYSKLKAFKNERDAYVSGAWFRATFRNDQICQQFLRNNGIPYAVQVEGTDTAGGFTVPEEWTSAIINNREEFGVFRGQVRVQPMGSDTMNVPVRSAGIAAEWLAEVAARTPDDIVFANVQLVAQKLTATTLMSDELSADSIISMADLIADEQALGIATSEDTAGFIGDGTSGDGSIDGIFTLLEANPTFLSVVDGGTGTVDPLVVSLDDLIKLMGAIPEYAMRNAKWYCSKYIMDVVLNRIAAEGGGNTIQTLEGAFTRSFLGFPIVVSQVLNSTTTANDTHILGFGDLSRSSILGDRMNITMSVTNDRYWELDQIGLKTTTRLDIQNHDIGSAILAGPFGILLATT